MTQTEQPYPVSELLAAVRAEIRAERRNDAKDAEKAELTEGRTVSAAEGRYEYLFGCRRWPGAFDGSPVLVRASHTRGPWIPGEASPLPDGKVRLVVAESLGNGARNVQARKDDSAGLAVLAERLEAAGSTEGNVRVESAGWIVGQGTPEVGHAPDPERWVAGWHGLKLNPRQRTAVVQALASEATFLWGPPGTGKTDVVGHIVEGNFRQGHNVLFLAPTKVAVDQALERICDLLNAEPAFGEGIVQRAGDIELPSLRERYGEYVDTGRIAARVSAQLAEAARVAREGLERARAGVALHDEALELQERLTADREAHKEAGTTAAAAERDALRAEAGPPACGWTSVRRRSPRASVPHGRRAGSRRCGRSSPWPPRRRSPRGTSRRRPGRRPSTWRPGSAGRAGASRVSGPGWWACRSGRAWPARRSPCSGRSRTWTGS